MKNYALFICFILLAFSAHAADWELYFGNQLGDKFFIDNDSIQQTPEGTIIVWRRAENADKKRTLETLYEVDCSRRRFKTLQGTIFDHDENKITPLEKSEWEYFEPYDLSTAFLKVICKTK